jgi:hypothetical protein
MRQSLDKQLEWICHKILKMKAMQTGRNGRRTVSALSVTHSMGGNGPKRPNQEQWGPFFSAKP